MNVLAVDCSSDVLAVGVARDLGSGDRPAAPKHPFREDGGHGHAPGAGTVTVTVDAGFRHVERLMGAVDFCVREAGLEPADLDLLACASGPGSFTGLRIAMSTVKGMALGLGKPFVAVPTLDAYAADWAGTVPAVVPVLDAKRSRFFFGLYLGGTLAAGPFDDDASRIVSLVDSFPEVLFTGPDAWLLEQLASERPGFRIAAGGRRSPILSLLSLAASRFAAEGPSPADASPLYLRSSDAEEAAARVSAVGLASEGGSR